MKKNLKLVLMVIFCWVLLTSCNQSTTAPENKSITPKDDVQSFKSPKGLETVITTLNNHLTGKLANKGSTITQMVIDYSEGSVHPFILGAIILVETDNCNSDSLAYFNNAGGLFHSSGNLKEYETVNESLIDVAKRLKNTGDELDYVHIGMIISDYAELNSRLLFAGEREAYIRLVEDKYFQLMSYAIDLYNK